MEESTNQPTQQPAVSTNLASLGDRFLGALIDWIVFGFIYYAADLMVGWSVGYVVGAAYLLLRDALPFLEGQSVGKKVMKTRAVKEDSGAPLTNDWGASLIRNVLLIIPIVSLIDALFIFGGDKRRLGDKLGKTLVIKEG